MTESESFEWPVLSTSRRSGCNTEARESPLEPRPDGGSRTENESAEKRHRILRVLREQLARHPATTNAHGIPDGFYAEVQAEVDPEYFERDADQATLRVTWQPNPAFPPGTGLEDRKRTSLTANFAFHYSESSGFDWGWHLEPNPHVSGHLHAQERETPDENYAYYEFTLNATSAVGVLWEVLDALEARLREKERS
ncbi:hypothetical protein [Haladaptatus halobius]|uniref:hypothetical protein n=1 Tax=Haladaptatus halobius TaxID=2884875 RepID=UPI001D0A1235|nr:hypothetical protein [Haladaptatus halobius]